MSTWISEYVAGCAICQQNKNLTHPTKIPLFRIPMQEDATPFSQVAFDLITQLPESNRYNAVLTVIDHGCSRAALFIPCKTAISGTHLVQLYLEHIYVWFGAPKKVISDRDPHFTSHFARAFVTLLRALRPDVGRWVTLSPRYWAGEPSDMDGGRAPYSAVPNCDPSWSSKLARCLTRQCKRICAKAETSQRRVSK